MGSESQVDKVVSDSGWLVVSGVSDIFHYISTSCKMMNCFDTVPQLSIQNNKH